jgi:hypothetical protein
MASRQKSFAITAVGFVVSTVFRVAFGDGVSALRRWRRQRGGTSDPPALIRPAAFSAPRRSSSVVSGGIVSLRQ